MKTKLFFSLICIVAILMLASCGISKDKYETAISERDTALSQITILQENLDASNRKVINLESDIKTANSSIANLESKVKNFEGQVSSLQSQANISKSNYEALQKKLVKAKPYADILETWFFVPKFTPTQSQINETTIMVDKTGNSDLKALWNLNSYSQTDYMKFTFILWDGVWEIFQ
jgi:septal ring factor EnvC (AmiA/AmiB activator)